MIACDIHPLNNTSPLRYLKHQLGQDQAKIDAWYHHWILEGFEPLEAMLRPGPYAFGGEVTLADICLVPQVYNARRLKVPRGRCGVREPRPLRAGPAGEPARRRMT